MPDFERMRTHLETDRLTMRPWQVSDAGDLRSLHAERAQGTPSLDDTSALIAKQLDRTRESGIALLRIGRRGDDDFLGYCGLIVGRASLKEPEIAYELVRRSHGNGYATEAAAAVLAAAVATGRERLWSTVRRWNTPSLRVLEKLGFERDRVTTDDHGDLVWMTRRLFESDTEAGSTG